MFISYLYINIVDIRSYDHHRHTPRPHNKNRHSSVVVKALIICEGVYSHYIVHEIINNYKQFHIRVRTHNSIGCSGGGGRVAATVSVAATNRLVSPRPSYFFNMS